MDESDWKYQVRTTMSEKPNKSECPSFDDHSWAEILEWAGAEVSFDNDGYADADGNVIEMYNSWGFVWAYGTIGFSSLRHKEDEAKARKATALFIYLWCKGVSAPHAERCAEAYVNTWSVRAI